MIKKYKIIILLCTLTIVCNVGIKMYIVGQQNNKIRLLQKVIAAARNNQYYMEEKKVVIPAKKRTDVLNFILEKIPEELSFTEYASDIESLIHKNKLSSEHNLIFIPVPSGQDDLLKYETRFVVTGDYYRLKKFIGDVSGLPGLVYLESFNIKRELDNLNVLRLSFDLSIYLRRSI